MIMQNINQLKTDLKDALLHVLSTNKEITDEEVLEAIDETIINKSKERYISVEDKKKLSKELFNSIRRLDILQELLEDNSITEIMINGYNNIFIERQGRIYRSDKQFESKNKLEDVIQQIISKANRIVNESSPIVDARLSDGSRINVVLSPIAINGPAVTIRKFPNKPITMEDLLSYGSITQNAAEFLEKLVLAGYNIFVSGGTGSGKTTFLNALSNYIPKDERIITIEDSAELQILNIPNIIKLEVRNPTSEGSNMVSIRDLIKSALRMRPTRIIVGEVRGVECIDMLSAFNTGHDGSLSTGHANSTYDMISRLETMVLMGQDMPVEAIRKQIASAIDIIVQLGRLRDKTRKVLEIVEIIGYENSEVKLSTLYTFVENGQEQDKVVGELKSADNKLYHKEKLIRAGIYYSG